MKRIAIIGGAVFVFLLFIRGFHISKYDWKIFDPSILSSIKDEINGPAFLKCDGSLSFICEFKSLRSISIRDKTVISYFDQNNTVTKVGKMSDIDFISQPYRFPIEIIARFQELEVYLKQWNGKSFYIFDYLKFGDSNEFYRVYFFPCKSESEIGFAVAHKVK